jgi:hypothetical protein
MPVQRAIDNFADNLQQQTIARLEAAIGREITYDSIAPSILLFLEIRGVEIERREDGSNLDLETIRVHYSFPALLQRNFSGAVQQVTIKDTSIRVDSRRDAELLGELGDNLRGEGRGDRGDTELPSLKLRGENINIYYASSQGTAELRKVFFNASFDKENRQINAEGRGQFSGALRDPRRIADLSISRMESRFSFSGTAGFSLERLNAQLALEEFESDLIDFAGLTIEIDREQERTVVRKIEDSSPWDLQLVIDQASRTITGSIAAEEFTPADNIDARSGFSTYAPWLSTTITGEAQITAGLDGTVQGYRGDVKLQLDNKHVPQPLTVEVQGAGNPQEVRFERLAVRGRSGAGNFSGTLSLETMLPEGSLRVRSLRWRHLNMAGRFELSSTRDSLTARSSAVQLNTLTLANLRASLQLNRQQADFNFRTGFSSGTAATAKIGKEEGGVLTGQGSFDRTGAGFLDLSLNMERVALEPVVEAAVPGDVAKRLPLQGLRASSEIFFSTDFDRYSFSLLPLRVTDEGGAVDFRASVSGNSESVLVEQIELQMGERDYEGRFQLDRLRGRSLSFQAAFSHRNRSYTFEGSYRRPSTILIKGNHGLRVTAFLRNEGLAFTIRAQEYPLPITEIPTEVSLHASGSFTSLSRWQLRARDISAFNLPGLGENSSVACTLQADPESLQVTSISLSDSISTVEGSAELRDLSLSPLRGRGWFRLKDTSGEEWYRGVISVRDRDLQGRLDVRNFPLARLKNVPMSGSLRTSLDISGTISSPVLRYSLEVSNATYNAASVAFSGEGRISPDRFLVEDLDFEYRNHLLNNGNVDLRLPGGEFTLAGEYAGILRNQTSRARVRGSGRIENLRDIGGLLAAGEKDMQADIRLSEITLFGQRYNPWEFELEKRETISVTGGPENAITGLLRTDGSFEFSLQEPLPVRMDGRGTLEEGELDMRLENMWVQMETFNRIGFNAVDFSSGTITGSMRIRGPSGDPEFFGELTARNTAGKVRYVEDPVEPFSTTISVSGKTGTIEAVELSVNGQRARFSGGLRFDRWAPGSVRIDIRTLSSKGVRMDYVLKRSGLIARGFARGTFTYALDGTMNRIEGNISISDFTITMQDKTPRLRQSKQQYRVDLDIRTGTNVQFLWPRSNLPILRAYLNTGQQLLIDYRSDPERYTIRGDVELRGGELYYIQRNFYLTDGAIHLNEDENAFNPLVELRARLREIDNTGRPVTIYLIVENEPLKSFTPRFESQPALSTTEIMQLLGAQIYSQFASGRADLTSALLLTGDVVSQFGLIRSFEQQMKETLRLDLFSIRTQMIQNVILDRVLNQPIEGEAAQRLSPAERYLDNTTLFLGKYLGNDLFLEGMLQLRRTPMLDDEFEDRQLDVHMEIGLEWQTPLFLLNFSVNPDFGDPVQSIYNTSLGFSWDYSY